ncbi:glycosyltransferase family 4 protein [uncultured Roseivirga sp.]|uniref:glycosyltransferase family 4 protein n=1 Tax=uncultured Roseivirga sp. TaxID=543088 RepID=UPI000D791592|nr:glycosyltransferase family 4 protein [uncultured Roseivirga sp.]PWL30933.1 MAG: hypothetical protein DCO95_05505 [Roseivirga sp. XM-24bin3]
MIKKGQLSLFSLQAGGNIGHGDVYLTNLCYWLAKQKPIQVYTFPSVELAEAISKFDNILYESPDRGTVKSVKKSDYNKYSFFKLPIYGFARARSYYKMISGFYKKFPDSENYHLLDFEYFSTVLYLMLRPKLLKRTYLGFHSSDFEWISGRSITVNLYKWILKIPLHLLVKKSGGATTHGHFLKQRLEVNLRLRNNKVHVIPYGSDFINLDNHDRELHREKYGVPPSKVLLLFGVLREDKGIKEVLQHFSSVSDKAHLLIAGADGDVTGAEVQKWVDYNDLSSRITLVNRYFTDSEMEEIFSFADFVVIPYKKYHIAFSGPLSLAVQYSRPVIASDIGEIGAFVKKYNIGHLFECEDWVSFVDETNIALENLNTFSYSFERCQQENSWEAMSRQFIRIYND